MKLYKISEFSKKTGLSADTLRYYHKVGILCPTTIDMDSGYRYYDQKAFKIADSINKLKSFNFSIDEIKEILDSCKDDKELKEYLTQKIKAIQQEILNYKQIRNALNMHLKSEKPLKKNIPSKICEIHVKDMLVAAIRFKGQFNDIYKYFLELVKYCGNYCSGYFMVMSYGKDLKSNKFDIEIAIQVSKPVTIKNIKSKILKGGKAFSLYYKGGYEKIYKAYDELDNYIKKKSLKLMGPPREIPIKGLFAILPRQPQDYITEIQFFVKA